MRQRLLNYLLKHLFNAVTENHVMRYNGKQFTIAGKILPENDVQGIISGAEAMQNLDIWKLMILDMKHEANKAMYQNSKSIEDMTFGKAMLLTIDVMQRKIDKIANIKK